jgi:cytochrome c oxidase cbb3-type subunit IV
MDAGTVRGLVTLALMLAFIGLVAWAWSRRRKAHFDEMAQMPFREGPQQNKGANSDE